MLSYIEFLRAFATVLVANSHFKGVYPNDIFSFGGGFGLGIFYLISGYLLANIKPNTSFPKWYSKNWCAYMFRWFYQRLFWYALGPPRSQVL